MRSGTAKRLDAIIDAALRGQLDDAHAQRLHDLRPEAVALAMLAASKRIAEQKARIVELESHTQQSGSSPSTPSGMVPIYTKPNTPKRRKKPGARQGHPGHRRKAPARIDERETYRLKRCLCGDGSLQRCDRRRTRTIEDIPEEIEPMVTKHTIWRDYCPKCRKHVEPVVPDALPRATIGQHLIALTAWLHYGLGVTIDQIIDILSYHLQTELTPGGLINAWQSWAVLPKQPRAG